MTTSYQKAATDVLDYAIDWTAWLAGDTISTSTWTVPTGITKASDSHTTTVCTAFLSGGTAGITYLITNAIVTAAGRTVQRSFYVYVASNEYV